MTNPAFPLIDQILSGRAPRKVKEFAAQGLLPIPQDDLIPVQISLSKDSDSQIAALAGATLDKIPVESWTRILEKKDISTDIVRFCLTRKFAPAVMETILLNASVPDEIFCQLAASQSGRVLDLILNNHVRLLRDPQLLRLLENNRLLSIDQRRRLDEFKTEFIHKKKQAEAAARQAESPAPTAEQPVSSEQIPFDDLLALVPGLDAESKRIIQEADRSNAPRPSDEQVQQELQRLFPQEELKNQPEETLSAYQRVMKMTPGEKLRACLLGTREERALLIRDSSKQVSSMVLKSPKLTDTEVETFAQMRNMDSDILRQIGQHREFLKNYQVIYHLTKNPKTPSPICLNLLKLLRENDLRNLERDRNIPELIRRQAKKQREMKSEKHG
jgi:hypothetical protein